MDLGLRGSVAVVTRGCADIRFAIGEATPVDGMVALQDDARAAAFLAFVQQKTLSQTLNVDGGNRMS